MWQNGGYVLPDHLTHRLDMGPLLGGMRAAIDGLAALGFPQDESARLPRYLAELESIAGPILLVMPRQQMHRIATAIVEGHILAAAFRSLSGLSGNSWVGTFATVCRGDYYPSAQHDVPRDLQAELFLAGVLLDAGFAVEVREPDLVVQHGKHSIAIAVKRPRTIGSVRHAVQRAVKQTRQHRHGLVFLDLTVAMEQAGKLWHIPDLQLAHPLTDVIGRKVDAHERGIVLGLQRAAGNERIGGVLTVTHVPMHDLASGVTAISQTWRNKVWARGSRVAADLIHAFDNRKAAFEAGDDDPPT